MSVVSSRISSVSSILKPTGVRSQLIKQSNRVYFKLPKNLKSIIYNYETGNGSKDYESLMCTLRDSNIKDSDLLEFLTEARQCVSLLGPIHKLFIESVLQVKWINRSIEVVAAYKLFLEDLICMQIYHTKYVIDHLIEQFKPEENNTKEWEAGKCKDEDLIKLNHIHDVLCKILKVVPMSSKLLLQSIRTRFPYLVHGTHTHEIYIYALLQILEYAPLLRSDILSLIINRLVVLDVNIPRLEEDDGEDEDLMEVGNECDETSSEDKAVDTENDETSTVHPIAHTLDVCMELILRYIHNLCFIKGVLSIEALKSLYPDLLQVFETVILPTHASQYVQYIMFYICSFKTAVAEAFIDWLWRKAIDPNVPSVTRQTSASYIASLLATAAFISPGLVKIMLSKISKWIHNYISMQDSSETIDDDMKEHGVFYSICQALFFIITARHKDFTDSKSNLLYLRELDLSKIITCKLNPLKACQPEIVHNFADITRMYQLAYCYTIIENNSRTQLPILQNSNTVTVWFDSFFPFNTYTLQRSGERIVLLFYDNSVNSKCKPIRRYKHEVEFMTE